MAVRIILLGIMALWAAYNNHDGFDPYPFILLNLFLSMIAGLQGAILLISAKRADSVSSEVAVHTLANTMQLHDMIEANTALTATVAQLAAEIHEHVCPPLNPEALVGGYHSMYWDESLCRSESLTSLRLQAEQMRFVLGLTGGRECQGFGDELVVGVGPSIPALTLEISPGGRRELFDANAGIRTVAIQAP